PHRGDGDCQGPRPSGLHPVGLLVAPGLRLRDARDLRRPPDQASTETSVVADSVGLDGERRGVGVDVEGDAIALLSADLVGVPLDLPLARAGRQPPIRGARTGVLLDYPGGLDAAVGA